MTLRAHGESPDLTRALFGYESFRAHDTSIELPTREADGQLSVQAVLQQRIGMPHDALVPTDIVTQWDVSAQAMLAVLRLDNEIEAVRAGREIAELRTPANVIGVRADFSGPHSDLWFEYGHRTEDGKVGEVTEIVAEDHELSPAGLRIISHEASSLLVTLALNHRKEKIT